MAARGHFSCLQGRCVCVCVYVSQEPWGGQDEGPSLRPLGMAVVTRAAVEWGCRRLLPVLTSVILGVAPNWDVWVTWQLYFSNHPMNG